MAVYEQGISPVGGAARAGFLVQYAGAAVSLALIAGIGVWGYKLIMRDVTGIPVVRAMSGDMRVLPANPGGAVSLHTGLSVNKVAAEGGAAEPEDTVALAPSRPALAAEDFNIQSPVEAIEPTPSAPVAQGIQVSLKSPAQNDKPLSTNDILALADQIAAGATPLAALPPAPNVALPVALPTAIGGLRNSVRPMLRPTRRATPVAAVAAKSPTNFTSGTSLVQLGAFPSLAVAETEWSRLAAQFGELMRGKSHIIQPASVGGRDFYRLRAHGFDERSDARRFCAALIAENADCIPVVVR